MLYIIQSKTLNPKVTYTKEWIYAICIGVAFVLFVLLMFIGVRKKIIYIKHISSALDKERNSSIEGSGIGLFNC